MVKKFKILFATANERPAGLIEKAKSLDVDIAIASSGTMTTTWYAMSEEVATALQHLKFKPLESNIHTHVFVRFETIEKIIARLQQNDAFEIVESKSPR